MQRVKHIFSGLILLGAVTFAGVVLSETKEAPTEGGRCSCQWSAGWYGVIDETNDFCDVVNCWLPL